MALLAQEMTSPIGPLSGEVILVAPFPPFRGGIAKHSDALGASLAELIDGSFSAVGFKNLYPKFLYPGRSDRDESQQSESRFAVDEILDPVNPLSWLTVLSKRVRLPATFIFPAWTFFVAPMFTFIAWQLRKRGHRVLMVVHNVGDHDSSGLRHRLSELQLRQADGIVTHSQQLADELRASGIRCPTKILHHPPYSSFPQARGTLAREFDLELLIFGLGRSYKGIDIALRALRDASLSNVRLAIVGEIWDDRSEIYSLADQVSETGRVEIIDRYVTDQEAAEYFARCDAVMATYRSVTGSGVVAMAQHYRKPVIASNLAGLREHIAHGKNGWLYDAKSPGELRELLREDVTASECHRMSRDWFNSNAETWAGYASGVIELRDSLMPPLTS